MNPTPPPSPADAEQPGLRRPGDAQALASSLAPALVRICDDRLRDIRWFRADWQRGGAATGRATFIEDNGRSIDVIVKIPVGHTELRWTQQLQSGAPDQVVPRMLAGGAHLDEYDIGWIVIEALPFGPLGSKWVDSCIPRIAEAAARFYAAAAAVEFDRTAPIENWDQLLHQSRDSVHTNALPERQRWVAALKTVQSRLAKIATLWAARPLTCWLHGDLHPANAMCREAGDAAPVTLIDLAEVRPGHWIEDAIYFERLLWTRPERLKQHKPVKELARALRAIGLPPGEDYSQLASVRRALLAATAPRFMKTEGNPAHLHACLERLEASLHELAAAGV